jgi:hypothetical protein
MKSEFSEYANSKIIVSVVGNNTEKDAWGNARPVEENIEIDAYLKVQTNSQARSASSIGQQQGANTFNTYLKGYLVKPMRWPSGIRPQTCEVEYLGKRGKLQVYSQLPRAFDTEQLTGDVVEGVASFQF